MAFEVVGLFVLRGAATYGSTLILSRIGNRIVATAQRRVFDRLLNQSVDLLSGPPFERIHRPTGDRRQRRARHAAARGAERRARRADRHRDGGGDGLPGPARRRRRRCARCRRSIYLISRILRRVRKFARRSYQGSTEIMQTMAETVLGARIVKAFGLETEMRTRMASAIRSVEGSANRIAVGAGLTTFVADCARRLGDRLRHLLRVLAGQRACTPTSARSSPSSARCCWPTSRPSASAAFRSTSRTAWSARRRSTKCSMRRRARRRGRARRR